MTPNKKPHSKHGITSALLGASVLIADRNPSAQKPLKDELNTLGVRHIDTVSSPDDLMKATQKGYAFIFIDSQLSDKRSTSSILEELAKIKKPFKEVLFVISSDRSSNFLQSLLEHEPDEYVIKPYSTDELSRKITRAAQKRKTVQTLEDLCKAGKFGDAIETADRLTEEFPQYRKEFFKKKIDAWINSGDVIRAEQALRKQIAELGHPWMDVTLAQILVGRDELGEAEDVLQKATLAMPEFTKSADALAMLLYSTDRVEEAFNLLEGLGNLASSSVERLRFMGGLARFLKKTAAEKAIIQRAIDRAGSSPLACEYDYHRLATLLVDENRTEDAINCVGQIKIFADVQDVEISVPLVRIRAFLKEGAEGKARETLFGLLRKIESRGGILSPGSAYSVSEICLEMGKYEFAAKLISTCYIERAGFWLKESLDAIKEVLSTKLAEKLEAAKIADQNKTDESKHAVISSNARAGGDLANRAKGALNEPG